MRYCIWRLDQPFFLGKPSLKHDCSGVALTRNFRVFMYDALWNPVLFVIYIAEQREIGLGLNTHIFEFDCFFAHEATFNGRSAVGLGVFSLTILQQQIIAGFHRLV